MSSLKFFLYTTNISSIGFLPSLISSLEEVGFLVHFHTPKILIEFLMWCSWPLALVIKLIPVPKRTFLSIILFWRAVEVAGVVQEGTKSVTSILFLIIHFYISTNIKSFLNEFLPRFFYFFRVFTFRNYL